MRPTLFLLMLFISLLTPFWFFILSCVLYVFVLRKPSYELIVIGVIIDSQFGVGVAQFSYLYTISAGTIVLIAEMSKPFLSFYDI